MPRTCSTRTLRALAAFGLSPAETQSSYTRHTRPTSRAAAARALRLLRAASPPSILLAGPSGAGKSTTLRLIARALGHRARRIDPGPLANDPRTAIDLLHGPIPDALRTLARAGLSDATLLATPARRLSDGQRWRLALALGVHRATPRRKTLIADEFGAGLDLPTALGVATAAARAAPIVGATSRDELIRAARALPGWTVIDLD